jgi:lysophospholipase L1-like esterase
MRVNVNERITWPTLCVFGDSIAVGSDDKEAGGWVARMRLELNRLGKIAVYNLGVDGDRVADVAGRLEREAAARNARVIIVAIGVNDLGWHGTQGTDPDVFRAQIDEVLTLARKFTERVLVLGLINVDESNDSHGVSNVQVLAFNRLIAELAAAHGAIFLDLYGRLEPADFSDGLHPRASGHAKLTPLIQDELNRLGWDE